MWSFFLLLRRHSVFDVCEQPNAKPADIADREERDLDALASSYEQLQRVSYNWPQTWLNTYDAVLKELVTPCDCDLTNSCPASGSH